MKKLISAILLLSLCLSLVACGPVQKTYDASDYILETPYKDDYRILQLTDIHLANKDNRKLHLDFMDLTIKDANADMILLSGDIFTFADKAVVKELFDFIDSYGVPWAVTWGNHDEQCYFSIDWLTGYLNEYGSNCLFVDLQDDDIYGNANYAINLTKGGKVVEQIILLDSNRYSYGDYWGYDYIKENQVDWYEKIVNYTAAQNGGKVVPSVLYYHIPVPEFKDAWEATQNGEADAIYIYGERNEKVSCPQYNSGLFDRVLKLGSTSSMNVGHDHVNNSIVKYKGVDFCYGINSTDRIYYTEPMMGGRVLIIHNDNSIDYEHIYHSYDEVAK